MANTSSHSLHSQAKNLADKVAFYIQAQALSSDFVRSDITRRDRMLQEFAQSPNVMTLGNAPPNKIHDPIAMMETYDSLLAQEPVTFEEYAFFVAAAAGSMLAYYAPSHFYRMHYAFSAYILYQVNVVDKEIVEKPELFPIYTKYSQSSLVTLNTLACFLLLMRLAVSKNSRRSIICTIRRVLSQNLLNRCRH